MNIETKPVYSDRHFHLLVDGVEIGEVEIEEDGRHCARLLLKDKRFLGGMYSAIFGHGDTDKEAFAAALRVGSCHHAALGERLAELEAKVVADFMSHD